jgi:hypothetical protein
MFAGRNSLLGPCKLELAGQVLIGMLPTPHLQTDASMFNIHTQAFWGAPVSSVPARVADAELLNIHGPHRTIVRFYP